MAVTNIVRNLRDGQLVIKDGTPGTPQSLSVLIDEGNLKWTERSNTVEVKDRGSIADGHLRKGDDESVLLSFTARWTQLIGKSADAADPAGVASEKVTFAKVYRESLSLSEGDEFNQMALTGRDFEVAPTIARV